MKDIIITAETVKRELIILAAMFVVAIFMNIFAIIIYDGAWSEFFTQINVVLALAVVLYFIVGLVRLIVKGVAFLVNMRKENAS